MSPLRLINKKTLTVYVHFIILILLIFLGVALDSSKVEGCRRSQFYRLENLKLIKFSKAFTNCG